MKAKILLINCFLFFRIYCLTAQTIWTDETKLRGTIGNMEIAITLAVPYGGATSCFVIGKYYYLKIGKYIDLCSEDDDFIIERVNGNATGYFIIRAWNKKIGQSVYGTWSSMDGSKRYPVTLKVVGKGPY